MQKGHDVLYLKRAATDDWRIRDFSSHPSAHVVLGDLDEIPEFSQGVKDFGPDAVLHLAWQGVTGKERDKAGQSENLTRTMALLQLARDAHVKSFIGLGSQSEYGNCPQIVREDQETHPTSLYGQYKLAAFLAARDFCQKENIRFAWLRLFSGYGPKDSPEFLVPYLISSYLKGIPPKLTPCEQLWDYIYVRDIASAIIEVAESQTAEGVFNLGSGRAVPLKDIVLAIRNAVRPDMSAGIGEMPYREDQIMHLQADITRIQTQTGWHPVTDLKKGIEETVKWYKNYLQHPAE